MNGFPKYGSIDNLYRSNEVLQHSVVVTEKIHGSNCRIACIDGSLVVGSRNNIVYKDGKGTDQDGFGMGAWAVANVDFEKLKVYEKYTFHGEFHGSNIQKGVRYCDDKDFRVFDVTDPDENYVNWDEAELICKKVGFKTVPVLVKGMVTVDDLNRFMNKNSWTAIENGIAIEENIAEGIVVKTVETKFDRRGNRLIAKYKSDKWAENTKSPKVKKLDPEMQTLQEKAREFANSVVTEGRFATILDHLTRDGNTEVKISRTGEFLRLFVNDVREEYKELYKDLEKKQETVYNKTVSQQAAKIWQDYLARM